MSGDEVRHQIFEAVHAACEDPLPVLTLIHRAADDQAALQSLRDKFGWSRDQAMAVMEIQFRRTTIADRQRLAHQVAALEKSS